VNITNSTNSIDLPCQHSRRDGVGLPILVMDDEKMIRNIASSMLKHLGYEVTTCATGEEAIERYCNAKELGTPFLAVIMNLTIFGGMGGKDAAQQIIQIDPDARLIVSSGYSDDPVMADHKSFGFCLSLPKPYRIAGMAAVLATLQSSGITDI